MNLKSKGGKMDSCWALQYIYRTMILNAMLLSETSRTAILPLVLLLQSCSSKIPWDGLKRQKTETSRWITSQIWAWTRLKWVHIKLNIQKYLELSHHHQYLIKYLLFPTKRNIRNWELLLVVFQVREMIHLAVPLLMKKHQPSSCLNHFKENVYTTKLQQFDWTP